MTHVFADVEHLTRDLLAALIASYEPDVTIGIGLPTDWTTTSPDHLRVALDGTPRFTSSIVAHSTIRVTAWASSTTRAKQLVALAFGLLTGHNGGGGISAVKELTGVQPARDTDNRAELAYVTVRVVTRALVI